MFHPCRCMDVRRNVTWIDEAIPWQRKVSNMHTIEYHLPGIVDTRRTIPRAWRRTSERRLKLHTIFATLFGVFRNTVEEHASVMVLGTPGYTGRAGRKVSIDEGRSVVPFWSIVRMSCMLLVSRTSTFSRSDSCTSCPTSAFHTTTDKLRPIYSFDLGGGDPESKQRCRQ